MLCCSRGVCEGSGMAAAPLWGDGECGLVTTEDTDGITEEQGDGLHLGVHRRTLFLLLFFRTSVDTGGMAMSSPISRR